MLAHIEALVGRIDDECVVEQSFLAQIVDDPAHVAVYRVNHPHVVVHVTLVFPFGQCLARQARLFEPLDDRVVVAVPLRTLRRRHALVVGASHGLQLLVGVDFVLMVGHFVVVDDIHILHDIHLLLGGGASSLVVVVEVGRQGVHFIVVKVEVARVGTPHPVGRLVVHEQAEGLVGVAPVVHPVDGQVGDDVGHVSRPPQLSAVADEVGVVVVALSDEDVPVVEARWQRREVPLADHRRLVAGLLEQLREGLLAAVERLRIVGEAVGVAVFARQHAGSGRSAQ